jgi:hypothetical protein
MDSAIRIISFALMPLDQATSEYAFPFFSQNKE